MSYGEIKVTRIEKPGFMQRVEYDYEFDGDIRGVVTKRSGAIRYVVEDDRGLLLIMNAKQVGL